MISVLIDDETQWVRPEHVQLAIVDLTEEDGDPRGQAVVHMYIGAYGVDTWAERYFRCLADAEVWLRGL